MRKACENEHWRDKFASSAHKPFRKVKGVLGGVMGPRPRNVIRVLAGLSNEEAISN